ncbi:hypothetical protein FPQ18DRAFT_397086 [Pyronema domesticum]|uniref:Uncharacterized protein n=1 Tax=Pyronema omphalodes (strain CBS 100304) TaxID=1076935 RepID=U4LSC3_PYROM|nr:hypothetical protein FPQ18DRAFT_397086 [Pyronema domesticum]CCX34855.1 Protein of unknown function [Pyronema omphalodes CBS 100304]
MHLHSFSRKCSHYHEIKKLKRGCGKIYRAIGGFLHTYGCVTREHQFIDDYGTVQTRYYVTRAEYKADKARDFGRSNATPIHEVAEALTPPPPAEEVVIHRSLQSYRQAQAATAALKLKLESRSSTESHPEAHSDSCYDSGHDSSRSTLASHSRQPSPGPGAAPTETEFETYSRVKRYLESQSRLGADSQTSSPHEGAPALHHEGYNEPPQLDSGYNSSATSEAGDSRIPSSCLEVNQLGVLHSNERHEIESQLDSGYSSPVFREAGDSEEASPRFDAQQLSLRLSNELESHGKVVQHDSGYNSVTSSEVGHSRVSSPCFEEHQLCLHPSDEIHHEAPQLDSGHNSPAPSLSSESHKELPVIDSIDIPYSIHRYICYAARRGAFSGGYSIRPTLA